MVIMLSACVLSRDIGYGIHSTRKLVKADYLCCRRGTLPSLWAVRWATDAAQPLSLGLDLGQPEGSAQTQELTGLAVFLFHSVVSHSLEKMAHR